MTFLDQIDDSTIATDGYLPTSPCSSTCHRRTVSHAPGRGTTAGTPALLGEETLDFHRRVREGFLVIAHEEQDRVVVIDATRPQGAVAEEIWSEVGERLTRNKIHN